MILDVNLVWGLNKTNSSIIVFEKREILFETLSVYYNIPENEKIQSKTRKKQKKFFVEAALP